MPATGRWAYPLAIVSVPRQAGKTALTLATCLQRATGGTGRRVWYTAQTGIKAREQFLEMIDAVEASPLRVLADCKRGAGDTRIEVPALRSRIKAHPPTGDSLHGNQSDLNVIDEGWFLSEPDGEALMGAITPTQLTRPNPQTIIVSTMGTADSVWFHSLVDRAREGLPGVALIEYGIADDVDPEDIEAIAAAHPAVGHTCTIDSIRDARAQLSLGEFARAYGNRRTAQGERTISAAAMAECTTSQPIPDGSRVAVGVAASIDGAESVIYVAAEVAGVPVAELVDVRPGTAWAASAAVAVSEHAGHAPIVLDSHGPAAPIAADLAGHHALHALTTDEYTTACADLFDRIHRRDPETGQPVPAVRFRQAAILDRAAEVAARRHIGDRWVWHRRGSVGSVAALEAATVAVAGITRSPAPLHTEVRFA